MADTDAMHPERPLLVHDSDSDNDDADTDTDTSSRSPSPEPPLNDAPYEPSHKPHTTNTKPTPKPKQNQKSKSKRLSRTPLQRALAIIESETAVLVQQGLLHGYLSHKHGRFVISGTRNAGRSAAEVGFPLVCEAMVKAMGDGPDDEVPGWIRRDKSG